MVELDENEFRRKYPNLWRELQGSSSNSKVRDSDEGGKDKFRGYIPNAIDYIRRSDTSEQAEKTISYLLEKGELTSEHACELRRQLREKGLRSFGPKKENGFYLREAGLK